MDQATERYFVIDVIEVIVAVHLKVDKAVVHVARNIAALSHYVPYPYPQCRRRRLQ